MEPPLGVTFYVHVGVGVAAEHLFLVVGCFAQAVAPLRENDRRPSSMSDRTERCIMTGDRLPG
jgi:hypothetical protein